MDPVLGSTGWFQALLKMNLTLLIESSLIYLVSPYSSAPCIHVSLSFLSDINSQNKIVVIYFFCLFEKKIIQQALVGEDYGEEQLFSRRLTTCTDLDSSLQKLEVIQLRTNNKLSEVLF